MMTMRRLHLPAVAGQVLHRYFERHGVVNINNGVITYVNRAL